MSHKRVASEDRMNSDLGEVLLESRPSIARRIAVSLVLLPIGLGMTLWSIMVLAFSVGVIEHADWDQATIWISPIPLAMGLLCLFANWWYLSRIFRCHEFGVSMCSGLRITRLPFRSMKAVRMRISESWWLGRILVMRTFEVWFDAQLSGEKQIAFTYIGISSPLEFARQITSIAESAGITPVWDKRN